MLLAMESDIQPQSGNSAAGRRASAPSLAQLAAIFFRIGATGFGGMVALVAMMHRYLVEQRRCVDDEEFAEAVAVGQALPGPAAVGAATYLGHLLRGIPGALVTTASIILPAAVLVVVLSPLYFAHSTAPQMGAVLRGVGAAVVAVVASSAFRLGKSVLGNAPALVIAAGSAFLVLGAGLQPAVVLLGAGVLGALLLRPPAAPSCEAPQASQANRKPT
ncbi:MAG: chromate transporter [Armatimonadetes bacterium]|nr:chromate transporter [Armatimonadota bacterium]